MSRIQIAAALAVSAVAAVAVLTLTAGRDEPTPRHGDAAAAAEPEPEAVRRCKTAVYGELDPEWRKRAVVAGPLALLPYLERRPELFVPDAELKVIAVVRSGASVTLAVPEAERQRISLLYDSGGPRLNRLFRLSDGTSSVRFIACSRGRETQFNGGFFVRDAHCAAIEVWTRGARTRFAAGSPSASATARVRLRAASSTDNSRPRPPWSRRRCRPLDYCQAGMLGHTPRPRRAPFSRGQDTRSDGRRPMSQGNVDLVRGGYAVRYASSVSHLVQSGSSRAPLT